MRATRSAAEVVRLGVLARGDQVPAGAAVADVVERGELARDVIGLVVGRRRGRDQADALGHHRQRRQQRDRLEMRDELHRAAERLDMRPRASRCRRPGRSCRTWRAPRSARSRRSARC